MTWCSNLQCGAPLGESRVCPKCGNDEDRAVERSFLGSALEAFGMADRLVARGWDASEAEEPPRDVIARIRPVYIAIARRISEMRSLIVRAGADPGRWEDRWGSSGSSDRPALVLILDADMQVRRGLDELRYHTRLDCAPLEAQVMAIRKSIDEWADALRYVRKQKPTADELASWHAAAAWYAQQEQRRDRER